MNILSISFDSDIWQHSLPEFTFLKSLSLKYKHKINYLVCDSVFNNYCNSIIHKEINFASEKKIKQKVCESCISTHKFYQKNSDFKFHFLSKYLDTRDYKKADDLISKVTINNIPEIDLYNIKIGLNCTYDLLLNHKLASYENLTDIQFKEYLNTLKNSVLSIFAMDKLLQENKIDQVLVYAAEYSINKSLVTFIRNKGIKVLGLIAGQHTVDRYKTLRISEDGPAGSLYWINKYWENFKNNPIDKDDIHAVKEFTKTAFNAKTYLNYSSKYQAKNIRKVFNIDKKYKKIILLAGSSQDERSAEYLSGHKLSVNKVPKTDLYKNEIEWMKYVIDIAKRKSLRFPSLC